MKRSVFLLSAFMVLGSAMAQNLNKTEAKALQAFFNQPAVEKATNGAALGYTGSVASVPGISVSNGHVTAIDWKDKHLAGQLNLSNFPQLVKVEVSGNKLTALTLSGNPALVEVNAGRNRISEFTVSRSRF